MPKFRTIRLVVDDCPNGIFTADVHVDADGEFYIQTRQLPAALTAHAYGPNIPKNLKNDTYAGLKNDLREMIRKYEEAQIIQDRVRVIRYGLDADTPKHFGRQRNVSGFKISWEILDRVGHGKDARYYDEDSTGRSKDGPEDEEREIRWSPERQAWFESVEKDLQGLTGRVLRFFMDPAPEDFAEAVDRAAPIALDYDPNKKEIL